LQLVSVDQQVDRPGHRVDTNSITVLDERDRATVSSLRANVSDTQPAGSPREPPVGDQGRLSRHPLTDNRRCHAQHLPHARPTLGALVTDDDDITLGVLAPPDSSIRVLLALEDPSGALERQL